jgi:hypothetical protein
MIELAESITALIKSEPKTEASRQARKMGLRYMGFGRYAGPDGNVSHIVVKDKLVPFKKDEELAKMMKKAGDEEAKRLTTPSPKDGKPVKKNTGLTYSDVKKLDVAKRQRSREDSKILSAKRKEIEALDKELTAFYGGIFNDDELEAIDRYTDVEFQTINQYLYNGHEEGTDYYTAKEIESLVDKLDSAFEETEAPFKYTTYTGLSDRYKPGSFKVGGEYIFKGYVSTSLDHEVSVDGFTDFGKSKGAKKQQGVVLELEIPKGAKSIYLQSSGNAPEGEYETLLPRGTKIKVVSGPHNATTDTLLSSESGLSDTSDFEVVIFKCRVVKDDV